LSLTLIIWLLLFAGLAIAAFTRPVYAVSLYMLTFFLSPPFWWWGDPIEGYRWNLISGCILLGVSMMAPKPIVKGHTHTIFLVSLAIIVNATLVNFVLAGNSPESADAYSLLLKFFVLLYAMYRTIRSTQDLQIVMLSILLGAAYIGFEIVVNDRGDIVAKSPGRRRSAGCYNRKSFCLVNGDCFANGRPIFLGRQNLDEDTGGLFGAVYYQRCSVM